MLREELKNALLEILTDNNDSEEMESYISDADIQKFHNSQSLLADSNLSAFFLRELESIEAQSYDTKYKMLKAFDLFPIDTSDNAGAATSTYRRFTKMGVAKIICDYADDAPRVDVYGEEVTTKIYTVGDSFGYSRQEIRESQMTGKNLNTMRAETAKRASDEKLNSLAWSGDSNYNISGFISYSGITAYSTPNGAAGTPQWSTKTPDEILADMNGIVTSVINSTNGVEQPNTMIMPISQHRLISTVRVTDTNETILSFYLRTNGIINKVDWVTELSGAGTGSSDRFMVYNNSRSNLAFKIPLPYQQLPPQEKGYGFEILTETRTAGIVIYYPLSVAYGDNI